MHCQTRRLAYATVFLCVGILLGVVNVLLQGPVPGDVAVTKLIQSSLGSEPVWANPITQSAKHPFVWGMLLLGCALVWVRSDWRGPMSVLVVFLLVKGLDFVLRAAIHTPKPIADFVAVASPSESSGLPSTFGLVYGAIFGCVIFATPKAGWPSTVTMVLSVAMIVIGAISRIVLGGHWTSQMLASLCIAFSFALFVNSSLERKRERPSPPAPTEPK